MGISDLSYFSMWYRLSIVLLSRVRKHSYSERIVYKKASIRWQDSAPPISGYCQPVSRTQASDAMTSRLPRWGEVCATQMLPMRVGPFAFRYQGNGAYIDTARKAIDCATTLPLTVFIWWNFAADFSSCIVEVVQKTINLCNLSPFWGS